MRAFLLKKQENISVSASLATILVERIFDGLVMLLFVFIALPYAPGLPDWLRQTVILASLTFLGALLLFLTMAALPQASRGAYRWIISSPLIPKSLQPKLLAVADKFMEGLASLRSFRDVLMVFFTSIIIWLLETVKYWFVMHAFGFTVTFFALMLMNGVVNLATTLPSAPGYIGTFDGPGIEVLKVFGVNPTVAAAYTLVLHAALWLPITILGIWYMVSRSMSWQDIGHAVSETQSELAREESSANDNNRSMPFSPQSQENESL